MKKNRLLNLIGVIIFLIIIIQLDFAEIFKVLKNINLFYFVAAVLCLFPIVFFKSWRWNYFKKIQKIRYPLKKSFEIYFIGLYTGLVTPGRIGEFLRVLYLKKDGVSLGKGFLSIVMDRVFDLISLVIFSYLSMGFLFSFFRSEFIWFSILFLGVVAIAVFLAFNKKIIKIILRFLFRMFIPKKYKANIREIYYDFVNDLKNFRIKAILVGSILTLFFWLFYFSQMFLLSEAIGLDIPLFYLLACISLAGFISLIPISISGLGTRDATLIFLFSLININKESAVVMSLLILLMSVFIAVIGLILWFKNPLKVGKEKNQNLEPA